MPKNLNHTPQFAAQGAAADEIVTGEAVVLELPAATAFSRIVSGGIDFLLYILCLIGTLYLARDSFNNYTFAVSQAIIISLLAFYIWILPATVVSLSRGSSLGKLLLRVRIVRLDGGTITARQAFIRAMIGIFEIWITLGFAAVAAIFSSKRAQRIGDMVAGTYVVRWPRRALPEPKLDMPPQLIPWAQSVQTRSIPAGLHLNIVNHFKQAKKLTVPARESQAMILAAAAEKYVSPPAPWSTPPEDF
ncbi:RDD family protein [Arcanobacterium hippocoleae]